MYRLYHLFRNYSQVKILNSTSNDIHFNLATEQYLFEKVNMTMPHLFLWRNSATIVIGRHQNPWKQCQIQKMKQNNIALSRRKTGGGAVYQDLGNSCFSFFNPYSTFSQSSKYKSINNEILLKAFHLLGIPAQASGRNDIIVKQKKISGSAYRLHLGSSNVVHGKVLHHGTVLFHVNLSALEKYLNPNKKKLKSKGIDSIKSRVMNIQDEYPSVNYEIFCKILEQQFIKYYSAQPIYEELNYNDLKKNAEIDQKFQTHRSWKWVYGQCPNFQYSIEQKFTWGLIEVTFNVQKGYIKQAAIYSDCLQPEFITTLKEQLIKKITYDKNGLQQLATKLKIKFNEQEQKEMGQQVCQWMIRQL